jgi:hypothetical protein
MNAELSFHFCSPVLRTMPVTAFVRKTLSTSATIKRRVIFHDVFKSLTLAYQFMLLTPGRPSTRKSQLVCFLTLQYITGAIMKRGLQQCFSCTDVARSRLKRGLLWVTVPFSLKVRCVTVSSQSYRQSDKQTEL